MSIKVHTHPLKASIRNSEKHKDHILVKVCLMNSRMQLRFPDIADTRRGHFNGYQCIKVAELSDFTYVLM